MNPDHRCKRCSPRIGVVIPARNESEHIVSTIDAIRRQTLQPVQIVIVDDRSTDDTAALVASLHGDDVTVETFPYDHGNWLIMKELARVFNAGLSLMRPDLDYVTVVGADEVLPSNHFETITGKMSQSADLVIASGIISGEPSTIPRGSGRIVDWQWWRSINGGLYPVNYGYESWLIAKCSASGKRCEVIPGVISTVQRPTGTQYDDEEYYHRGQAFQALGYNRRFVLGRIMVLLLRQHKIKAARRILQGYVFASVTPYDDDIRKYYHDLQNRQTSIKNISWLIKKFMSFSLD